MAFYNHEATDFVMRNMPSGDISKAKFFVPMFDGGITGYYEILGITFGSRLDDVTDKDGTTVRVAMPCLNIKLGNYRPFGDHTAEVPMYRNWNGQIHTFAEVMQLYNANSHE